MKCRHCAAPLVTPLIDLGSSPPSNAYLTEAALHAPELWFPLRVLVCDLCRLVQTEDFAAHDALFTQDYAYFSSFSHSWLEHSRAYAAQMTQALRLNADSLVVEVASNDGYLLQYFAAGGIPALNSALFEHVLARFGPRAFLLGVAFPRELRAPIRKDHMSTQSVARTVARRPCSPRGVPMPIT